MAPADGPPPIDGEYYRIVVTGEFGDLLSAAFDDVVVSAGGGKTVLIVPVRDSQELYGLMDRLRDHGVQLETVTQIDEPAEADGPSAGPGKPRG